MPATHLMSLSPDSAYGVAATATRSGISSYTHHQGKFFALWLTLSSRGEVSVARALSSARVDMNPHPADAALFALKSPVEASH